MLIVFLVYLGLADAGVHFASMPGASIYTSGKVTIDFSNAAQGYVAVKYAGTTDKLKVRVSRSGVTDTYDLNCENRYEVYPLKHGAGTYTVSIWRNVGGSAYAQIYANSFQAKITDELLCYLYPNQYVWYEEGAKALDKAVELCDGLEKDMDKISALFSFVRDEIKYDHIKALTVSVGYMPVPDETLESAKGICFDKAALLACMLRSQGIPTQLVVGMLDKTQKHAWNKVYVDGKWRMLDPTFAGKYKSADYEEENVY